MHILYLYSVCLIPSMLEEELRIRDEVEVKGIQFYFS